MMNKQNDNPTIIQGLDSLRWYSALAVIVTHIELHKGYRGLENIWQSVWIQNLGPAGVYFFFTLSGFLITLLLNRKRGKPLNSILGPFYLRRAFRILPLYYFMVLLGFFILPIFPTLFGSNKTSITEFIAFILWQPHFAQAFLERVPNISHLWSIGVELTFYCFWPLLLLRSINQKLLIFSFVFGMLAIKAVIAFVAPMYVQDPQPIFHLAAALKFECMGIGAWFALNSSNRVAFFQHPATIWVAGLAMPLVFLLYGTPLDDIVHVPLSILFGIVIKAVASRDQKDKTHWLNSKITSYLGRVSYGIYCYHYLCISVVLNSISKDHLRSALGNVTIYMLVLLLTIAISSASFHLFEQPITRYAKHRTAARKERLAPNSR